MPRSLGDSPVKWHHEASDTFALGCDTLRSLDRVETGKVPRQVAATRVLHGPLWRHASTHRCGVLTTYRKPPFAYFDQGCVLLGGFSQGGRQTGCIYKRRMARGACKKSLSELKQYHSYSGQNPVSTKYPETHRFPDASTDIAIRDVLIFYKPVVATPVQSTP